MLLILGGGLIFGLLVFFACEEMSLKHANFSDMRGLFTEELKISECLQEFNTIRYLALYVFILLIFDLILANMLFVPKGLGLLEMAGYTFAPSLIGSWIILLVKWTYQPVIKLASSFMYGAGFIGAAIVAFAITNLVS